MAGAQMATLLPLTIVFNERRVDMAVPPGIPVAEILPGIVSDLGRLTESAATQGFTLATQSGRVLDLARSLADQHVNAGSLLTLTAAGVGASDLRYDDLAEAISLSLDTSSAPWRPEDSVYLSAYAAVGLLAVAAALLTGASVLLPMLGVPAPDPLYSVVIGAAGAVLVAMAAAVVARAPRGVSGSGGSGGSGPGGAIALAMAAPVLLGSAGFAATSFVGIDGGILAGAGFLVGAAAVFALPAQVRACAAAPLLVGVVLVAVGVAAGMLHVPLPLCAGTLAAVLTLVTLAAPWIGLASMPARIPALSGANTDRVDVDDVDRQTRAGGTLVLAIRVAAGLCTVVLAVELAIPGPGDDRSWWGTLLGLAIGLALMLGTRTLYRRSEALVGMIAGMATILASGVTATLVHTQALPWTVGVAIVVAVFVLANNVVSPKLRPAVSRIADVVQVIALAAILPLAVLMWGLV